MLTWNFADQYPCFLRALEIYMSSSTSIITILILKLKPYQWYRIVIQYRCIKENVQVTLSYSPSQPSSSVANVHFSTFSRMSFLLRASSLASVIRSSMLVSSSERSALPTKWSPYTLSNPIDSSTKPWGNKMSWWNLTRKTSSKIS